MGKSEGSGKLWFYVIILIIGALLGSVIGEAIGVFFKEGIINDMFVKGITPGLKTATLDLYVISLTFGFTIKLNLASVIGILCAALLVRKLQ